MRQIKRIFSRGTGKRRDVECTSNQGWPRFDEKPKTAESDGNARISMRRYRRNIIQIWNDGRKSKRRQSTRHVVEWHWKLTELTRCCTLGNTTPQGETSYEGRRNEYRKGVFVKKQARTSAADFSRWSGTANITIAWKLSEWAVQSGCRRSKWWEHSTSHSWRTRSSKQRIELSREWPQRHLKLNHRYWKWKIG